MKNKKSIPLWIIFILILVLLISLVSLVLSIAALGNPIPKLIGSPENFIAIIGIILALIAASATVFSIVMSHDISKYRSEIDEYRSMFVGIGEQMQFQFKETLYALSTIESVSGDKAKYIRLAQGRLICRSKYADKELKRVGISYIQGYYMSEGSGRSAIDEDIQILKNLTDDFKIDKDIRESAQRAIDAIEGKDTQQKEEDKKSNLILTKMQQLIDKIEGLVTEKSGGQKRKNKAKN